MMKFIIYRFVYHLNTHTHTLSLPLTRSSELTLYMTEKSFMGTRRLLAADVYVFLNSRKVCFLKKQKHLILYCSVVITA